MQTQRCWQNPKPGDQIEIFRSGYQHWAIYVGNGYVVHLTSADGVTGSFSSIPLSADTKKAVVKKEKLSEVAGKDKWEVNNEKDRKYKVKPVDEIIRAANKCVGMEIDYNVVMMNCEHFATALRYGQPDSTQVCRIYSRFRSAVILKFFLNS
ncbi:phospholipase A and acyltransferase 3-like isoform X1 [Zootoca vivipara]|uniref:phospholipase A and acyltransferase 3-like isoform X1 n=1 Tax=Zootoca vivipara TaxID=8524 RepID=UPI00293BD22A|nr:phospholipase A and acyltransferase 3-like isoform X1 [Zootoca vivipara]